jgi:hypothetical protein
VRDTQNPGNDSTLLEVAGHRTRVKPLRTAVLAGVAALAMAASACSSSSKSGTAGSSATTAAGATTTVVAGASSDPILTGSGLTSQGDQVGCAVPGGQIGRRG